MATTHIISIHVGKGKTAHQSLKERLDYIINPEKTDGGILISSHACSPETAADEFMLYRQEYLNTTGRKRKDEVLAYHVRQAFKPGEITREKANEIGKKLAERLTDKQHAFVVATHTDKQHIQDEVCQGFFGEFYLVVYGALRRLNMRTGAVCFGQDGLISVSCWAAC